jgi:cation diffusion facilitator family transporter
MSKPSNQQFKPIQKPESSAAGANPATASATSAGTSNTAAGLNPAVHLTSEEILKSGTRVALLAMGEIILLALMKAFVGYTTGIVVLVVDAMASFSDVLGVIASYIGLKMSRRHADEGFKYGYYKAESFAAFLASLLIIYGGYMVLRDSIDHLFVMENSQDFFLAAGQIIVTVLVSTHLSYYLMKTGKKIHSLSLVDSAKDKRNDILAEIPVAIGVVASFFKIPYLEGAIGIILSLLILKVGLESGKESLFFLLDYFDDQELVKKVEATIMEKSRIVRKVKNIRMRRAGTYIFGEAFVEINPFVETKDIRGDLIMLKEKIANLNDQLKDFSLFFEVPLQDRVMVAVPVKNNNGLQSVVASTLEETQYYVFVDVEGRKIIGSHVKAFPFRKFDFMGITNYLKDEKVRIVINNNMHSLLFYNLRRLHHILVYPHFYNVTDVENTIKLLLIDT